MLSKFPSLGCSAPASVTRPPLTLVPTLSLMLMLVLMLVGPPAAADPRSPPPRRPFASAESLATRHAMDEVRAERWNTAAEFAERAGPLIRDVVAWHRLRAGDGTFDEALRFLERRPDWPGLDQLRQWSEASLPLGERARDVIAFFDGATPTTGHGVVALVNAYREVGAAGDAEALAALAWLDRSMTAAAETVLLGYYRELLRPLHVARLDAMLWEDAEAAVERMLPRIDDEGLTALARARLALRNGRSGAGTLVSKVPGRWQTDPGLAYERFRAAHAANRDNEAATVILERSARPELLGQPARWAGARRDLARTLMRAGRHREAHSVASAHWLEEGSDYADLEWLSGYLALRFLDDPGSALKHFQKFRAAVFTPISLGRAGYWEGRAHEALGDAESAASAYAFGAEFQTSFYGLLAAERAGLGMDPGLTGAQVYPPLGDTELGESSVFQAARQLLAAKERDLAARFFVHLAETLEEAELGTLGDFALSLGDPHVALLVAKQAAQAGLTLPRPYFPVVDLGLGETTIPPELILSIARRESEFRAGAASGVGARGLMQLMPGTAQDMARKLGLPFSQSRLFSDPVYNATLGTAYLAELFGRFGPNVTLVSSGYNAGPGRPLRWISERGDPRAAGVDPVDWIEHIPFDETRNYVMRVAESLPVYRARLNGETEPIRLTDELKR